MKVLFLTNIPSPYRVDFFNELGHHCDLTVLYERNTASDRDSRWKSASSVTYKAVFLGGINITADSALCFPVINYLNDKSYDLIVVGVYSTPTGMLAIQYMKMRKIPYILSCDGGFVKKDSGIKYKLKKYFISSASAWLSTGKATNAYIEHYGADVSRTYIYPFTSLRQEDILNEPLPINKKAELKEALGINYEFMIVSVGQFIYRKGFDILIKACTTTDKNIGTYIIGGQPTTEYIDLKEKYELDNLHFLDFKKKSELNEFYGAADIFVLPTREDIWGLVINEAMAMGLPVITTDRCIAGLELVENNVNGFIVPVDNSDTLAKRINYLAENKEALESMSNASLSYVEQYSIENMANQHIKIFNDILNKKSLS